MGLPIYGIVAATNTAMDREGRSVPAPGKGILSTAKETFEETEILSLDFRHSQILKEKKRLIEWLSSNDYSKESLVQFPRLEEKAQDYWGKLFLFK